MTTIVMNTLTGAVSEYDWAFQSITPTHAGDVAGLYLLGGELDGALPIAASFTTGKTTWGSSLRKHLDSVYFGMVGAGLALLRVVADSGAYSYEFLVRSGGMSRAKPGHGLVGSAMAFGFSNVAGAAFRIDRIEVPLIPSRSRRVG